ncbi:fibrous sheath-interacting protein 1 isoform 2-T2 [Fundulus diaphanus]
MLADYSIYSFGGKKVNNVMEIIKGGLDAISRPASGEQRGSRVGPAAPRELFVLSNDSADVQNCRGEMEHRGSATEAGKDQSEITDEQNEDSKLQQAFEEMRRLDEILSAEIFKEKEIRRQRKELQAKLWKELQRKTDRYSECAQEALNTKLFLALEAHPCKEAEDRFAPLFETQVPDCEHDGGDQGLDQTEKQPDSLTESFKGNSASIGGFQFVESNSKTPKTKNKERDFVQRNIELVSSEAGEMPLTRAEKARLAELLQEINEEEKGSASGTDSKEAMWATSASAGQGYTPEPSDLEQLMEIDSKIRLLLPAAEFHSLESSYTDLSVSQNESADLIEEQLLCLLGECERTKSWSRDNQRNGTMPSES